MTSEHKRYFDEGLHYQEIGDFQTASDCFKKVFQSDPTQAEAWYLAGLSFLKLKRKAEGGMYLRRALKEFDDRIAQEIALEDSFYYKACTLAWLQEKDLILETLEACFTQNPIYVAKVRENEAFLAYQEEEEFYEALEQLYQKWEAVAQAKDEAYENILPIPPSQEEAVFEEYLQNHQWEIDRSLPEDDAQLETGTGLLAQYPHNERLHISMSYLCQEHTILLALQSKKNQEEEQAYRIYKENTIKELLQEIVAYQDEVHEDNWMEFIGVLVDVCDALTFEMPDGRTVKIA